MIIRTFCLKTKIISKEKNEHSDNFFLIIIVLGNNVRKREEGTILTMRVGHDRL